MSIKSSPDRILDILAAQFQASTVNRRAVAASATSVAIAAADPERVGLSIYNNSTTTLYVGLGTVAASLSDFTVAVPVGGFYEVPTGWAGFAVQGIWAGSPTGNAQITEVA